MVITRVNLVICSFDFLRGERFWKNETSESFLFTLILAFFHFIKGLFLMIYLLVRRFLPPGGNLDMKRKNSYYRTNQNSFQNDLLVLFFVQH